MPLLCAQPFLSGPFSFAVPHAPLIYTTQWSVITRAFASGSDSYKLTGNCREGYIKHHFSRVPNAIVASSRCTRWTRKVKSQSPPYLGTPQRKLKPWSNVFLGTTFTPERQRMLSSLSPSSSVEEGYLQFVSTSLCSVSVLQLLPLIESRREKSYGENQFMSEQMNEWSVSHFFLSKLIDFE